MRKHPSVALFVACLVALVTYASWAIYQSSKVGDGWLAMLKAWPYLLAGVLTVAAVIGLFVWLALYSDKHGYDARAGRDDR